MLETKKVYLTDDNNLGYIYDLSFFGWKDIEENKEKINNKKVKYHILSRDTEIPNYSNLCNLEEEYEKLKKELTPYPKSNPLTVIIVCCLILPIFTYYFWLDAKIKAVNAQNEPYYFKMREILDKAKEMNE